MSQVAAYWAMDTFHLAGPMEWTGEVFEGDATAFVSVWSSNGAIHVVFSSKTENTPVVTGGIDEREKLVDAYVARILNESAGQ